jgi:hypothetical protein
VIVSVPVKLQFHSFSLLKMVHFSSPFRTLQELVDGAKHFEVVAEIELVVAVGAEGFAGRILLDAVQQSS